MNNYTYYNPTKLYFGPNQIEEHLGSVVKSYGSKVLFMYGFGSIKKNGVYDKVMKSLAEAGVEVAEFQGVEPNPQYTTVNRATDVCKEHDCDVVLAVGGGSVIDAAKVVTQAKFYDGDCWDLVTQTVSVDQGLPLIAIPTMASAGSENDAWAVISNADTNQKLDPWGETFQQLSDCCRCGGYPVSRYRYSLLHQRTQDLLYRRVDGIHVPQCHSLYSDSPCRS